jgi:hypothetical protein
MSENEGANPEGNEQEPMPASAEMLASAHAAMVTADAARANIERYLQMHGPGRPPHLMRIAADANVGLTKLVQDSVELAAKTLEAFLKLHRGG